MSGLIPIADAQQRLIALGRHKPSQDVDIANALGRYLSQDLLAKRDQPAANMAAMDGYAVCYRDADTRWKIMGECKAGSAPCAAIKPGEAARIFTGALMPDGADTVIMQENMDQNGDHVRLVSDAPKGPGQHVRKQGSDFNAGSPIMAAGTQVTAAAIGHIISAGYGKIACRQRPSVAIISNGDELLPPGAPLKPHQIHGSNSYMLNALLSGLPAIVEDKGLIADDLDLLSNVIGEAQTCDIIVTIGGASVGDHDLVKPALQRLGAEMDFLKVAMKPGKPLMAGTLGDSVILGLPGNPASAFVTATLFLLPMVRFMAGCADYMPPVYEAISTTTLAPVQGRTQFLRATVNGPEITAFSSQDSAKLSVLAQSNALLVRPANDGEIQPGSRVSYIPL